MTCSNCAGSKSCRNIWVLPVSSVGAAVEEIRQCRDRPETGIETGDQTGPTLTAVKQGSRRNHGAVCRQELAHYESRGKEEGIQPSCIRTSRTPSPSMRANKGSHLALGAQETSSPSLRARGVGGCYVRQSTLTHRLHI